MSQSKDPKRMSARDFAHRNDLTNAKRETLASKAGHFLKERVAPVLGLFGIASVMLLSGAGFAGAFSAPEKGSSAPQEKVVYAKPSGAKKNSAKAQLKL